MSREYVVSSPTPTEKQLYDLHGGGGGGGGGNASSSSNSNNNNNTDTTPLLYYPSSVRSDNSGATTVSNAPYDDYYFEYDESRSDPVGTSPRNNVSSPLEYSDESDLDVVTTTSYRRRSTAVAANNNNTTSNNNSTSSKYRSRPPESLLDNVYNHQQQQQQQQASKANMMSFSSFNLFRTMPLQQQQQQGATATTTTITTEKPQQQPHTTTATTLLNDEEMQRRSSSSGSSSNSNSNITKMNHANPGGNVGNTNNNNNTTTTTGGSTQKRTTTSSQRKQASVQQQQQQEQQRPYLGPQIPMDDDDDDDDDPATIYNQNNSSSNNPNNNNNNNWMVRLAYSFRSSPLSSAINNKSYNATTITTTNLNDTDNNDNNNRTTTKFNKKEELKGHRRQGSDLLEEYPHYLGVGNTAPARTTTTLPLQHPPQQPPIPPSSSLSFESWNNNNNNNRSRESSLNEGSPLIGVSYSFNRYSSSDLSINYYDDDDPNNSNDEYVPNSYLDHDRKKKLMMTGSGTTTTSSSTINKLLAAKLAAAFLQDYEANRPPTLGDATTLTGITDYQMTLYHIKHSLFADIGRCTAVLAFFISSFMEQFSDITVVPSIQSHILTALNIYAITILLLDIWLRSEFRGYRRAIRNHRNQSSSISASTKALTDKHEVRISRSEKLIQPLIFFCGILLLENIFRVYIIRGGNLVLFTSILKPLVLFYISSQARDAFEAVRRILRIVVRVLIMEMLLILMFAAVACRLFQQYDKFRNLGVAWVSLFELATTVVNPSIWMPIYQESKLSAVFFIFFIITTVFYLHSLVLSVVFQTYIQAASDIHERNASDKEDTVYLAFLALLNGEKKATNSRGTNTDHLYVDIRSVRQTLKILRPHYSSMKINALVEIVDPAGQGSVDYTMFRTKIRQALNASIRTARNASNLAMGVELMAAAVAFVNFVYVLLVSSKFNPPWFAKIQVEIGCIITLVAATELIIRFNPIRIPDFTPLTRLNATFDGSAIVAAVVSFVGIISYLSGRSYALEYILMGRALDMIRILRLFQIFRDVCRRTADVLPAIMGPLTMVVSTLHIFTYIGMVLWGGSVIVGQHPNEILTLYDLNNFNSYQEGSVTMFQVLAVNDWYAIADVFLFATRNSSHFVVYSFFILANIICVSIMLNVLTAFFVESFVTKLHDDKNAPAEATTTMHKDRSSLLVEPDVRRVTSVRNVDQVLKNNRNDDLQSVDTTESERFEFDVYERQGYDKIMQTVVGSAYHGDAARDICRYLEVYESLSPGRSTVGYLVCDQQTLERFGNRRFRTKAIGYLDESNLHSVVTDMHSELLALAPRTNFQDRSLVRTFPHKREVGKALEISGAILRRHPTLSLFVSKTITAK